MLAQLTRPITRRRRRPPNTHATRPVGILGLGAYVPEPVLSNSALETLIDVSNDWIVTRTGIESRRVAARHMATSDLAVRAAGAALSRAGLDAADLDLILVATMTPDSPCPATAARVQHALGAHRAAGYDLHSACTGFVNALMTGHQLVAGGLFDHVLVIGADTLSTLTDYRDRSSCLLFGDGAGAVVLGAGEGRGQLLDHVVGMDGSGADLAVVPAGGSRRPPSAATVARREHFVRLDGPRLFRFAVDKFVSSVREIAERNGIDVQDIDLVVPHQANRRIIEAGAQRLGLDADRVFVNVDRYGNTAAASIPIALEEAVAARRIASGDLVCLVGFGGGLTWGASLLQW